MNAIRRRWVLAMVLPVLCTACASAPDQSPEPREEKIYRTGSNIPVKDYGGANIEQRSAEVINPVNRPMAPVMNRKPGG
jgi:hypothetical protein